MLYFEFSLEEKKAPKGGPFVLFYFLDFAQKNQGTRGPRGPHIAGYGKDLSVRSASLSYCVILVKLFGNNL